MFFLKGVGEVFTFRDKHRNTINDVFTSPEIRGLENAVLNTNFYPLSRPDFCVSVSPLFSSGLWKVPTAYQESKALFSLTWPKGISY